MSCFPSSWGARGQTLALDNIKVATLHIFSRRTTVIPPQESAKGGESPKQKMR